MLDYTEERIRELLLKEGAFSSKINPEELVKIVSEIIDCLRFMKNNLPGNSIKLDLEDPSITIWVKQKVKIEEFKERLLEDGYAYVLGQESPLAVNLANELGSKYNGRSFQVRLIS